MQVFFGESPELGAGIMAKTGRAIKKGAGVTGRVTARAATGTAKLGAKGIRAAAPLAPVVAFVPGVGPVAATALTAGKTALDTGAKARKAVRPAAKVAGKVTAAAAAYTKGKPKTVISAPKSILEEMRKKKGSFLPGSKLPQIPGLKIPGITIPGLPQPGEKGPSPAPAPTAETAPQGEKSFVEKNWPLLAAGAVVLFMMTKKR